MTETRIRWEPTEYGGWTGHVGTLVPWAFQIYHPTPRDERWILQAQLPGALGKYVTDPDDPEKLGLTHGQIVEMALEKREGAA